MPNSLGESIKTDIPIPLYYQLKQLLKKYITDGIWKPEERIPTEKELCEKFHVSRTTVRQAINELVNESLLKRSRGKGTFVAKQKLDERYIQHDIGFYQEMESKGLVVKTKVLDQVVISAPEDIASKLQINEDSKVIRIERLRSVENEKLLLVVNYIPYDICPGLENENLNDTSLYGVLMEKYGLKIETGTRIIEAIPASDYDAYLLGIPKGSPLLLIRAISYMANGKPLEYFETKHRGDRCRFEVEVIRPLL